MKKKVENGSTVNIDHIVLIKRGLEMYIYVGMAKNTSTINSMIPNSIHFHANTLKSRLVVLKFNL